MSPLNEKEILETLRDLSEADIARVLAFIQQLRQAPLRGVPGKDLVKFAGILPVEVSEMRAAIEEGCERIDYDGW